MSPSLLPNDLPTYFLKSPQFKCHHTEDRPPADELLGDKSHPNHGRLSSLWWVGWGGRAGLEIEEEDCDLVILNKYTDYS